MAFRLTPTGIASPATNQWASVAGGDLIDDTLPVDPAWRNWIADANEAGAAADGPTASAAYAGVSAEKGAAADADTASQVRWIAVAEGGAEWVNVAVASAGGVATASSTLSPATSDFPVASVNNGDRSGAVWAHGGAWANETQNTWTDWVQIVFGAQKTINRVIVYTTQDNPYTPVDPSDTMVFTIQGNTDFTVQGWDGSAWVTLGTVTGNNLVKRTVNFSSYTTDRIRINVTAAIGPYAVIAEIEAFGELSRTRTSTTADTPSALIVAVAAVAEAGTALDTDSATLAQAAAIVEAARAADSPSALDVLTGSTTETGTAADTPSALTLRTASAAESGAASDSPTAQVTLTASSAEAAAATDTESAAWITSTSVSENAAAVDTESATTLRLASTAETGAALDTDSALTVRTASTSEAAAALDATSAQAAFTASQPEAASVVDTETASAVFAVSDAEVAALVDSANVGGASYPLSVAESGASVDAPSALRTLTAAAAEATSAADAMAAQSVFAGSVADFAALLDAPNAILIANVSASEFVAALDLGTIDPNLTIDDDFAVGGLRGRFVVDAEHRSFVVGAQRGRFVAG